MKPNAKLGMLGLAAAVAIVTLHLVTTLAYYHVGDDDTTTILPIANSNSNNSCKVVLTYDNRGLNDGAGAQAQRILSLYLIAKHLGVGVGYLHTPIAKVIYQGLDALADNASRPGYEARWNEAFELPSFETGGCSSSSTSDNSCTHIYERSLSSLETVRRLQRRRRGCSASSLLRRRQQPTTTLLHVTFAHEVTDAHPEILDGSRDFYHLLPWVGDGQQVVSSNASSSSSTEAKPAIPPRPVRIAIHVRRGDLKFRQGYRMLPNAYYVAVARELARIFDENDDTEKIPWELDVYTEAVLTPRPVTITPNQVGLEPRELARSITIAPDHSLVQDFRAIKNARMRVNGDPLQAFKALVAADVLVLSPSSFSYVAGLLRPPGAALVIYHPFWHAPRSDWFCMARFKSGDISQDDADRLRAKIKREFEPRWRFGGGQAQ